MKNSRANTLLLHLYLSLPYRGKDYKECTQLAQCHQLHTVLVMDLFRLQTRRSMAKTNFSLCLLCQQLKKMDKHNYERLSDCQMDSSPGTLVQAARIRDDTRVLLATEDGSLDFHAAEVKYHASCYRDYTSKTNLACVVRRHNACKWEENSTAGDVQERTAFDKAFSSLVYLIETKVICGKHSQNVTTSF